MDLAQVTVDCGYGIIYNASDRLDFLDELAVEDSLRDTRPSELYSPD